MKVDLFDEVRLKCIFKPLEVAESNGGAFAWSGGVIFTDAMGFHAVVSHLETRLRRSKQKVWNWHVVHHIPSCEDRFPEPRVGMFYVMYIGGKSRNAANPKDGFAIANCEDSKAKRVLEFLFPILFPEKPTRVMMTVGNTIFGALLGERKVD